MGIGICAVDDDCTTYPRALLISFQCDGHHRAEDRPGYTFRGVDYITAYADIMAMGWLERRDDYDRLFLCPTCSGKKPKMPAPIRTGHIPPWSYSHLNCFINCAHQYFRRYIAKDVPYVKSPKQDWGNKVHTAFERRIGAGVPLPVDMAKWEVWAKPFAGKPVRCELQLGIRENGTITGFFDQDVWGRVKIDTLVEPGDQTARIFDWKTGRIWEDPFELRIQGLFAQALNPALRAMAGWYVWLGQGANGQLGGKHDITDVERTWAEVTSIVNTMNNNLAVNHWPKKPGVLCAHCDVKDCEHNRNKG